MGVRNTIECVFGAIIFLIIMVGIWIARPIQNHRIKISETETIYINQRQTCLEIAKALGKECED